MGRATIINGKFRIFVRLLDMQFQPDISEFFHILFGDMFITTS